MKHIKDSKIVMIGAGNLATQLSINLIKAGFKIAQVYSRTLESASSLADKINSGFVTFVPEIVRDADIYILAVKDDAIVDILNEMPQVKGLLVHTAGSVSMNIFASYTCRYGVFYPLQTFGKNREISFGIVPLFIEAVEKEDEKYLFLLANSLSEKVYILSSEKRKYLHLAAVFACNFTNHMYVLASKILENEHIPWEVMIPLIDETARKIYTLSPEEAQTGPAVRCDREIMQKHLQLIENETTRELYKLISKNINEIVNNE